MNHSSLFSLEEFEVWDPKVIRKYLVVPQHQLAKLNEIPGWAKVEDNRNTLRLYKDFSIGNSQSECSVIGTQNNQRIERIRELFNNQTEDRKKILISNKVYREKLVRSLSLFDINESSERITLKRTFSLQSLCKPSVASDVNNHFKKFICENALERHLPPDLSNKIIVFNEPFNNNTTSNQYNTVIISESETSKELLFSKELNSRTMETVSKLPENVSTSVENTNLHFEAVKENNGILPVKNIITEPKNIFDVKDVSKFVNTADVNLNSETKEIKGMSAHSINQHSDALKDCTLKQVEPSEIMIVSNGVLPAENSAVCSNNVPDEHVQSVIPVSSVSSLDISGVKKVQANLVPVSDENATLPLNIPEIQAKVIPVGENIPLSLNDQNSENISLYVQEQNLILSSNSHNKNEANSFFVEEKLPANAMDTDDKFNSVEGMNIKPPVSILEESDALGANDVEKSVPENAAVVSVENKDVNSDIPAKESSIPKTETILKTENLGSGTEVACMINGQKECDPSKSVNNNNEGSSSKKRKLESRGRRSKRLKSDEKQGNFKIRSIKKVREICYSVEEVKTMLDILKQF